MHHPLYNHAMRLVGRPVFVHHINGRVYHGTLQSVTPAGIYVIQHPPTARPISADGDVALKKVQLVYSPASYFAFGALTGLTLGAFASPYYWW